MSTIGYKVTETAPGHVNITCEQSGRPFTRTTEHGMFCDSEECVCEQKSQELESSPEFAHLEKLVDLFSR